MILLKEIPNEAKVKDIVIFMHYNEFTIVQYDPLFGKFYVRSKQHK